MTHQVQKHRGVAGLAGSDEHDHRAAGLVPVTDLDDSPLSVEEIAYGQASKASATIEAPHRLAGVLRLVHQRAPRPVNGPTGRGERLPDNTRPGRGESLLDELAHGRDPVLPRPAEPA
ncbi:hypothetical protein GCM10009629_51470 [Pseudonocardia alni]